MAGTWKTEVMEGGDHVQWRVLVFGMSRLRFLLLTWSSCVCNNKRSVSCCQFLKLGTVQPM